MNIQQLTYIVEIANCKSISRAAEYLFVSQPALSQQIRNLEKELGYRLHVIEKEKDHMRISQDKQRTGTYRKRECFLPKSARNAKRLESF